METSRTNSTFGFFPTRKPTLKKPKELKFCQRSNDIEENMKWIDSHDLDKIWAGRRDCQETLPLLVRKLIRATSNSIQSIKFPAGENVLIRGWDGILEVTKETEYLPIGLSLWEFGASKNPKGKADDDYQKRTKNSLGYNPAESTFIFVTPRLWKNGEDWANEKKKGKNMERCKSY